jgi:hypothetical protein
MQRYFWRLSRPDCEEVPLTHIPNERLRELAEPSLTKTGYVEVTSVLSPEESAHFRECSECIDALANMVREIVRAGIKNITVASKSG